MFKEQTPRKSILGAASVRFGAAAYVCVFAGIASVLVYHNKWPRIPMMMTMLPRDRRVRVMLLLLRSLQGAVGIAFSILGAITLMPITISGAVRSPSLLFEKICAHDVLSVHIFVYYGNIIIIVMLYARAVLIERILSRESLQCHLLDIYIERNLCY